MIELNLLPEELRKKKKKKKPQKAKKQREAMRLPEIPALPVIVGLVAAMIILHVLLSFRVMNSKNLQEKLTVTWGEMQPQKRKTDEISSEIARLEKKVVSIRKIAKTEISWSKMLSGLNQAVIPNIWLSELEIDFAGKGGAQASRSSRRGKKKKDISPRVSPRILLNVSGYALGRSQQATSLVARFITSLKESAEFSEYFDKVELENMKNRMVAKEEVMMFRLSCTLKSTKDILAQRERKK